ncbi:MAG: hypothetical protein ACE15C_06395 [Phycisphaerae bacterium]
MTAVPAPPPNGPTGKFAKYLADLDYQKVMAYFALGVPPAAALIVIYLTQFRPYSQGMIGDARLYGVSVPTLMAAAVCLVSGMLALAVRTPAAAIACCAGAILTAAAYFTAMLAFEGAVPLDVLSLSFLVVPVLAIAMLPRARRQATGGPLVIQTSISKTGDAAYTAYGLIMLFAWLMWFDFCFLLMEGVLGTILQFKLNNDLGISGKLYKIFMTILPGVANFILNPIFSIKSDRHRGPRGRRIPFLMYGTPLVCAILALIGFGNEISAWVHSSALPWIGSWWPAWMGRAAILEADDKTVAIWTFGILSLVFFIVNMPLGTTYYYLFNDVVPEKHFIKLTASMRLIGTLVGMIYNAYIYGYSDKSGPVDVSLGFWSFSAENVWYPKIILVGAAVFYMVAGFVCYFKIREPHYPPPPPLAKGQGFIAKTGNTVRTIVKECFIHRFYVLIFITMTVEFLSYQMGDFMNPMRKDLGMDLQVLGVVNAWGGLATFILTLLTVGFGDKFHPMPLMVVSMAFLFMTSPIGMLFLIPGLSSEWYLGIQVAYMVVHIPISLVNQMAAGPLWMTILPRERYGQFSAAGVMIRVVMAQVLGAFFAGWLMDQLRAWHGGSNYCWRYSFSWNVVWQGIWFLCYYLMWRQWKKMGGKKGFKPPKVGPASADEAKPA